jgi:hypothetical protein
MLNVKQTLKNLHKKFPTLGLDELFEVLDCYVEEYTLNTKGWEPPTKIWYSSDKTTGVNETPTINCITSKNVDFKDYPLTTCTNGKIKYYDGGGSIQLAAEH